MATKYFIPAVEKLAPEILGDGFCWEESRIACLHAQKRPKPMLFPNHIRFSTVDTCQRDCTVVEIAVRFPTYRRSPA